MRAYVICSVFIIVGLISIVWKTHLGQTHALYPYVDQLPGVFLVSGVLSLLYKVVEEKESREDLRRLFRIHDSIEKAGLVEIRGESQDYNFTLLLEQRGTASIVLNDGLRWTGNNAVALSERFSRKGTVTEVFLVATDSPFIVALAKKVDLDPGVLKEKIASAIKRLTDAYEKSPKDGVLKIFGLKNYPTHSIFLTNDEVIITPYQVSSGRARVPVLVYERNSQKDGMYNFVARDVEQLREESTILFPIPPQQPQGTPVVPTAS